jgi:hypothetical protein
MLAKIRRRGLATLNRRCLGRESKQAAELRSPIAFGLKHQGLRA